MFVLAALSPGLVYHRVIAQFLARDNRSTVVELVEMATAGAVTSVVASVVVLGLGEFIPPLVSLDELAWNRSGDWPRPWSVVASALLVLFVSFGLAVLAGWMWVRRAGRLPTRIKQGSAWAGVLGAKRDGKPAFLAVELDDGRLIEGVFRSVSVAEDPARDALVLRPPILSSGPGDSPRTAVNEDFVFIPRSIIKAVHGSYRLTKRQDKDT
ncbi:hypothetical protein JT362_33105 [Actinophytocola sp. S1-96]|uniref:Uncharacterized protein n=1 Tax=Actinophytocola gossypii TaxID=2812003 RepID=A0ABT2JJA3_9PSEU|nr:hypothetical protein [Actinophytocola gossypii]